MSIEPIVMSLMTRCNPLSKGPPLGQMSDFGRYTSLKELTIFELLHHKDAFIPSDLPNNSKIRFILTDVPNVLPSQGAPVGVMTVLGTKGKNCNAFSMSKVDKRSTKKMKSALEVVLSRRIVYILC